MWAVAAVAETLAVYVDGFNLYHGLHQATARRHLWLDLGALAQSLRPQSVLTKVMYFTAPVLNDAAGLSNQQDYEHSSPSRPERVCARASASG